MALCWESAPRTLDMKIIPLAMLAFGLLAPRSNSATLIRVDFEGLGPVSYGIVPGVFHNGSFDAFNSGETASPALEALAEHGSPLRLLSTVPAGANPSIIANGSAGAGISGTSLVSVKDGNGFFSFAAKLLPSNDWFIGNDTGFDASSLLGTSAGTMLTFNVSTVWDAGTELEDFGYSSGNSLFPGLIGGIPGGGVAQNGVISEVTSSNPFSFFSNQPDGFNPQSLNFSGNPVARFTLTVVPEPSSAGLQGLAVLSLLLRRKR